MEGPTLEALQRLKDAQFHAICDEIIPRLCSRCFPLTPHGRNDRGDSVRGQPDSYVGDSARACRIAIQYTVQATSWWAKVIEDVKEARAACPDADEIIVALPRNVDREPPKQSPGINWLTTAQENATPAKLTIISGRQLSHELDTSSQDLRWVHLGIPCSRVNFQTLAASCKEATSDTIARLVQLGRYNPSHYVFREADRNLFAFWQDCLRHMSSSSSSRDRRLYIPLVADSGVGKTSLLAHFAQKSSLQAPVLLLLARDLLLDNEGSLVRAVVDRLQGSISVDARLSEEAALAAQFRGRFPMTVVVDGLDETGNAAALQRVVSGWLSSRLGSSSVLVTTSRVEFWRTCRDASWQSVIHSGMEPHRTPKPLRIEEPIASVDPLQGIKMPGIFSVGELAVAWENAGREPDELWTLPPTVRESLRHPFAARSAMDLLSGGVYSSQLSSRATILNLWLQRRLQQESNNIDRVTPELLQQALLVVAKLSFQSDGGWVKVDQLQSAPRFDPLQPPGPVVERLITCALLETSPEHADRIRFTNEAVQDYYRAELSIQKIRDNPEAEAIEFANMSFSQSVVILECIGAQIANTDVGTAFIRRLADVDAAKAAVCMRPALSAYPADCRRHVAKRLGQMQRSTIETDRALAVELLGRMNCSECVEEVLGCWSQEKSTSRIRTVLAHAVISLGIPSLAHEIFRTWWFTRDGYFVDLGPELAASSEELKNALVELANIHLSQTETEDYRRAVTLCGYLLDPQAVDAIRKRTRDAHPRFYESLCLLRLGSEEALRLYKELVDRYLQIKAEAEVVNAEYDRWSHVFPFPEHIGRKPSQELVNYSIELIQSSDKDRKSAGCSLAGILYEPDIFAEMVRHGQFSGLRYSNYGGVGRVIGADRWLELWNASETVDAQKSLLSIAADLRDSRVEDILIVALQNKELCNGAAHALARTGSTRACPHLRAILTDTSYQNNEHSWKIQSAIQSLISLRDDASIDLIIQHVRSDSADENTKFLVATRIASIGTSVAEEAVLKMDWASDEQHVAALIGLGSRVCIESAVELAKQPDRGVKWLLRSARHAFFETVTSSDRLRSDVEIESLLSFVRIQSIDRETVELLEMLLDDLNTQEARDQYAQWWSLRGTVDDFKLTSPKDMMLSDVAKRELARRGDRRVLREHLDEEIEQCTKYKMAEFVSEKLAVFNKLEVITTLKGMLSTETDEKRTVAIIDILGRVGDESTAIGLGEIVTSSPNIKIVNAAREAFLRIADPLRLAQYW